MAKHRVRKTVVPAMTAEKVRQVQELRRSNATRQRNTTTRAAHFKAALKDQEH